MPVKRCHSIRTTSNMHNKNAPQKRTTKTSAGNARVERSGLVKEVSVIGRVQPSLPAKFGTLRKMSSRHLLMSASSLAAFTPFSLLGYEFTVDSTVASAMNSNTVNSKNSSVEAVPAGDARAGQMPDVPQIWVSLPATEAPALIKPSLNAQGEPSEASSQLDDVLLLLSLAHAQDIVRVSRPEDNTREPASGANTEGDVTGRSACYHYRFGKLCQLVLAPTWSEGRCQHAALEHTYRRIQDPQWQRQHAQGACLRIVQSLGRQVSLSSAVSHAWWLLEHLFALNNNNWLSSHHIRTLAPLEKVLYLLRRYVLTDNGDTLSEADRQRCQRYVQTLHQLTYRAQVNPALGQAALAVVHLAEYCLLALVGFGLPSDAHVRFDSVKHFEEMCQQPEQLRAHMLNTVTPT